MERRLLEIAENYFYENNVALIAIDREGRSVTENSSAEILFRRAFGRTISPGMRMDELVSQDDFPEFSIALQSVLNGQVPDKIVSITKSPEGRETWFESVFTPVKSAGGVCAVVSVVDITQRKITIDQLAESEQRFKSLVQNTAGIIAVTDASGRISWISDSVHRYLGYHAHECRGRDLALFIHGRDIGSFNVFLVNLRAVDGVTFSSEIQFMSRGGESVLFEIAAASRLSNPSVEGIVFNMHDVTERRNLDQVTLRLARQNELILETASEGIFGINKRGIVSFVNPFAAEILGRKPEEIVGVSYLDVFTGERPELRNETLFGAVESGSSVYEAESVFCRKDGTAVPVEFSVTPVREGDSGTGSVVTFRDVSRRNQIEEELRRARDDAENANHAKSDFLALMSHEIRTPMNSVLGFIEMLSLTQLTATQREYLATATTNARHLLGLISDILDLSKIEKGRLELESAAFIPSDEIAAAVSFFGAEAEQKKLHLVSTIEPTPACLGDSLRLRQVIANLLGNAMKFTSEAGTVTLRVSASKDERFCAISVSVSDSGIGMTKEQSATIFDPFTQAELSIAKRFGGTGLGLSISARLVALMGGKLRVESEPQRGSRFYFDLKLPVSHEQPRKLREPAARSFPEGMRVLVAEDTQDSRRLIRLMLETLGVACDTVANGREAFERSGAVHYDVIFMDGNMPICDGFTAARMIRSREVSLSLPRIPIIALSARAVTGDREKFLEAGMDDYVTKPVSIESLRRAIGRTFSGAEDNDDEARVLPGLNPDAAAESLGISREDYISLAWGFLLSLDAVCTELAAAVEANDRETSSLLAHRIKGSAANFRFTRLSALCADMEKTPQSGLFVGGMVLAAEIRTEAARCVEDFRRFVTG